MKLSKAQQYYNDYKQIAFKLQSDIDHMKWEQAAKDLPFAKEIREHLIAYHDKKDVTHYEMAHKMLSDWIDELQNIHDAQ